ncbi:MAG: response regulator [Acidiferrobacterales bacterium]|nr:response regulator [Acidiferrobacterales bacterium]
MVDKTEATIYIVDDNAAVRDAVSWLVQEVGLKAIALDSAQRFLDSYKPGELGCLVLDIRMPGMSGLVLQDTLVQNAISIPVIIITGHGDVPMAVKAMKMGAFDFLQKPFNDQELLDSILNALNVHKQVLFKERKMKQASRNISTLTRRELEVLELLRAGNSNKKIATQLKISVRTVEGHRAKIMGKMQANSVAQLVESASQTELAVG